VIVETDLRIAAFQVAYPGRTEARGAPQRDLADPAPSALHFHPLARDLLHEREIGKLMVVNLIC
jgi:hypothetical protein